ncbi:MAG TPA: hypothetical protein VHA55_03820 [Pseudorhodoplanes sp.]|jgi:hypothetical protein|nr:hypothetical protein [Pseudorhodoplanes sp.]
MRKLIIAALAVLVLIAGGNSAHAWVERVLTGAAIGAGSGALLAGPAGAAVGGVIGGVIGGPVFPRGFQECWYDRQGHRRCNWR